MKKLLAVLALVLIASPAFAVITGSPHDLSGGTTELCVYCHTPHAASAAVAPLWNRTPVAPTANYTGTGTFSANGTQDYTGTDVSLCLSCHDGATAMNAVLNQPTVGGAANAGVVNNTGSKFVNIGDVLSNDHPVGFNYATVDAIVGEEIQTPTAGFGTAGFPGVLSGAGMMQCSTCHDVHDNTLGAFLVLDNAGSGLCLECHLK